MLEGIDGAGTTTQSRILVDRIRELGFKAVLTGEPSDGPIGSLIRKILKGEISAGEDVLALLFAADRLHHIESFRDHLKDSFVVSDRYVLSSLAYQGSRLPLEWVASINSRAIPPDLVIIIDVDVDVALSRISNRPRIKEKFENKEDLAKIRSIFLDLADRYGAFVVDGNRPVEEVSQDIWNLFKGWAGVVDD